ncbi:hypothetical protein Tco_0035621, partial [Tanacetum coccineum]
EREVREGEVPLLELTRGRVIPLPGVNDQGDANIQGVVNEGNGDVTVADEIKKSDHVVPYEGDNIVADDEIQYIVANKPKGTRKKRKAASGAWLCLASKQVREDPWHRLGMLGLVYPGKSLAVLQGFADSIPLSRGGWSYSSGYCTFCYFFCVPYARASNATDAEVSSIAKSLVSDPPIMTMDVATTVVADCSSVPVPRADNEPVHHTLFADSASIGEANQDIAGPSHP